MSRTEIASKPFSSINAISAPRSASLVRSIRGSILRLVVMLSCDVSSLDIFDACCLYDTSIIFLIDWHRQLFYNFINTQSIKQRLVEEQTMNKNINKEGIMQRRAVKVYFDDEDMDFNLMWVLGNSGAGGAELGECMCAASQIK